MVYTNTKALLVNCDDTSKQEWLTLPFSEEELNSVLAKIGVSATNGDGEEIDPYDLLVSGKPIGGFEIIEWSSSLLDVSLFEDLYTTNDLIERIESRSPWEIELLQALLDDGDSLEEAIDNVESEDCSFYDNTDLEALAEELGNEDYFTDEYLLQHVDWSAVARDLEDEGYTEINGGVLHRPY